MSPDRVLPLHPGPIRADDVPVTVLATRLASLASAFLYRPTDGSVAAGRHRAPEAEPRCADRQSEGDLLDRLGSTPATPPPNG